MSIKKDGNGSFGIYAAISDGTFKLINSGFKNTLMCERWIKKNPDSFSAADTYVIMDLKKVFSLDVKVKHTVYIKEPKEDVREGIDG